MGQAFQHYGTRNCHRDTTRVEARSEMLLAQLLVCMRSVRCIGRFIEKREFVFKAHEVQYAVQVPPGWLAVGLSRLPSRLGKQRSVPSLGVVIPSRRRSSQN